MSFCVLVCPLKKISVRLAHLSAFLVNWWFGRGESPQVVASIRFTDIQRLRCHSCRTFGRKHNKMKPYNAILEEVGNIWQRNTSRDTIKLIWPIDMFAAQKHIRNMTHCHRSDVSWSVLAGDQASKTGDREYPVIRLGSPLFLYLCQIAIMSLFML